MDISLTGLPAKAPAVGPVVTARKPVIYSLPDKDTVTADAGLARSSKAYSSSDWAKSQARARVQQIVDRLKVLKKLFANDPKGMARALTDAFKELKAAVKAYGQALGDQFGLAGGAVSQALAEAGAPAAPQGDAATAQPDPHALYEAVKGEVNKGIGEEGLAFMKEVRALVNELSDTLDGARTQMRARRPEKAMSEAFEDADSSMKALRDALGDLEFDIHRDAPMAGIRLSVAA